MRNAGIFALLLAGSLLARAQDDVLTLADIVQRAQDWAGVTFNSNAFTAWPRLDSQTVHQFFRDTQRRFQGEYVVRLASFQHAAEVLVPWLESRPETRPYGDWLKERLDYCGIADAIRFTIPPPEVETIPPAGPGPNLVLATVRGIWLKKVERDFLPPEITNYVVRLKGVFIAQKVPAELFWLAEVESAFDANARSPAGAVGLYQLKPDTARRFGLSLLPFDQRLEPEDNARGSAQYLRYLHDRFQDWRLALAGYNAGERTVQRLLDRYHTRNYDEIARRLPAETRAYVLRVEAIVERREGARLGELHTPPDWIVQEFRDNE